MERPAHILWNNAGFFGVIEKARVANIMRLRQEKRRAGVILPALRFAWDEVTLLGPSDPPASIVRKQ